MNQLTSIQPFSILLFAALAVLASICINRNSKSAFLLTLSGFLVALFSLWPLNNSKYELTTPFFIYNACNLGWMTLVLGFGVAVAIYQRILVQKSISTYKENYLFLIVAVLGGEVTVSTNHLAFLLVGLKLWWFPLYLAFKGRPQGSAQIVQLFRFFIVTEALLATLCFVVGLIYCRNASFSISEVLTWQPGPFLLGLTGVFLVFQRLGTMMQIWKNALLLKQGIREKNN